MVASEGAVDTFGIVLPDTWIRIPLDDLDFEEFVRGQRRRLAKDGELTPTATRQLELLMRQLRNDCQRANVSLAGTLISHIEQTETLPDGDEIDPGLLTATCTISTVDRDAMGSRLPLTVNTIAAAMGRQPEPDDDGVVIANLAKPEIVTLPAGQAVKLVRLHTHPPSVATGEKLAVFAQHVLVPFDAGQQAAVVTFSTVSVSYSRPLSRLFDRMMETFRMFGGDTPTDPVRGGDHTATDGGETRDGGEQAG